MKYFRFKSIQRLEPSSFTIIMATGAYAIATQDMASTIPWLVLPAYLLNLGNFVIFIILVSLAMLSWPTHRKEFLEDFNFPQRAAFYGATGIAFLVLGAQGIRFGMDFTLSVVLWAIGCALTLVINFVLNFHFFVSATPELKLFTPVFFIPVGGLVVIPVAGAGIMAQLSGIYQDLILMINMMSLGGGLLLYLGLFSLLLQRHYLMEHIPHHLVPTIWIHLAPIGWSGVSFLNMAEVTGNLQGVCYMIATLLWGGCCWWLIMCILLTIRAIKSGKMEFSLAYWAFIFPLGSITILSYKLGQSFNWTFYLTWSLMSIIWLVAAFNTIRMFCICILKQCCKKQD